MSSSLYVLTTLSLGLTGLIVGTSVVQRKRTRTFGAVITLSSSVLFFLGVHSILDQQIIVITKDKQTTT